MSFNRLILTSKYLVTGCSSSGMFGKSTCIQKLRYSRNGIPTTPERSLVISVMSVCSSAKAGKKGNILTEFLWGQLVKIWLNQKAGLSVEQIFWFGLLILIFLIENGWIVDKLTMVEVMAWYCRGTKLITWTNDDFVSLGTKLNWISINTGIFIHRNAL